MTSQSDKEPDFFEVLAGREKGLPVAEGLREALQAEAEAIKQAKNAQHEKLQDYEIAWLDSVKKQLIQSGVFKQNSISEPSWLRKFFDLFNFNFANQNWGAGFAVAASVMVVCLIMYQQSTTDKPTNMAQEIEATRGDPSTEVARAENQRSSANNMQREQRHRYSYQQNQQARNTYQQVPNASYSKNRPYINERTEKKNTSSEPDAFVTDESTSIAGKLNSKQSEPDTTIDEPNTQIASETEHASQSEQYAKAESPKQLSALFGEKFSDLLSSSDKQKNQESNESQALGMFSLKLSKKHGFAIFDTNPEKKVSSLENNFSQIGAEVVVAQINDDTWIIEVSMPDATKLEAIKKQMVKEGFSPQVIAKNPPYEIRVQREK